MSFFSKLALLAAVPAISAAVIDLPVHIQNTYSSVQFEVGTPPKPYRLLIDTGSGSAWMTSSTCNATACPNLSSYNRTGYDASGSSTSVDLHAYSKVEFIDGDTIGGEAFQDVFTDELGTLQWNQTFLSVNQSAWRFITADGFIGFSFASIAETKTSTVFETLLWANQLDEPRFSLFYGTNVLDQGEQNGVLTMGGSYEDKYVDGDVVYVPLRKEDPYQVWRTGLRSIGVFVAGSNSTVVIHNGQAPSTSFPASKPAVNKTFSYDTYPKDFGKAVFDTGAGRIAVPNDLIVRIYDALGWDYFALTSGEQRWTCASSNSSWAISFTIGNGDGARDNGATFSIRGDEFISPDDPQCQPPVDNSDGAGFALIGSAFLRRFYSVWDFGADRVENYQPRVGFGRLKQEWDYFYGRGEDKAKLLG